MLRYLNIFLVFIFINCDAANNSPWILQATYDSGSSSSFVFRKDGTFEWINGSGLGVTTYEGKYAMKDSIITLDKIGFDRVVKSKRLLITSVQPWTKEFGGKYVIQVNEKNKLLDSIFIFTVYFDKRDSL